MTEERAQDFDRYISVHEAGHVVVADALGFTPQCVKHVEGGLGVGFEAPDKPTPHEFFGMAAIALAGGLAQDRDGSTPDCGCFEDLNFAADHVIDYLARDLPPFRVRVLQWLGLRPYEEWAAQEVVDATMQRAASLAQSILSDRWEVVIAVADLIDAHDGELDEQQLAGVLAVFGTGRVQEIRDGQLHRSAGGRSVYRSSSARDAADDVQAPVPRLLCAGCSRGLTRTG